MPKRKFFSVDRHGNSTQNDKKAKIGILSEETMSYYRNVSSSLEQGFDNDEDLKDEFLTNVYNTLRDEGIQVSQNQTVSRILEVLFSHSKPCHMQDLFCLFCGQLTVVVFDRFASHVFQSLIQYLPAMYDQREEGLEEVAWRKSFHEHVNMLCQFMESHLRDVMTHTYGSHVLRSFLEALGGVRVLEEVVRSRVSRGQRRDGDNNQRKMWQTSKALSEAFASSFTGITEKLIRICNFEDHLSDQNFCPVLQTVMLILNKTDLGQYQALVSTIVEKTGLYTYNEGAGVDDVMARLPDIVQNEVGSYLVELLLTLASKSELQDIYTNLFKKRIIYFCVHPIANYVLQKMLSSVEESHMMEELLQDIVPYMEDILAVNHIGIVTKLAEACKRTGAGQDNFLKALMGAFHCLEPEDRQKKVAPLLASLQTYEVFYQCKESKEDGEDQASESKPALLRDINFHGSLLLQQLLVFQRPMVVSSSMTELSGPELAGLASDRCGSHVLDAFFNSRTVLEKFKVTVLKKLQGSYITIACTKNGSRCLENIWKSCALKQKIHIADDLAKNQARLESDQWGRFLYRNFALAKFSQRRKEWIDVQASSGKKQKLIRDIIEGSSGKNKKRKNKVRESHQQSDMQEFTQENDVEEAGNQKTSTTERLEESTDAREKISPDETSKADEGMKKKRKRQKEKKRSIRSEEATIEQNETDNTRDITPSKKAKEKKKKKRKLVIDDENFASENKVSIKERKNEEKVGENENRIKLKKKKKQK